MQYDSSGTDDDLPPTCQIRGPRVLFSANGRSSAGALPHPRPHSEVDSEIHQIEQQAYTGVLRAFKVQSDAITWEKESLITELRKELKVSDEEHRVLLNKVNEEESVHRIRQSRHGGGMQSSLPCSSTVVHNPVPVKRQKKSDSIHRLPVAPQSPVMLLHAVASKKANTMAPEDIRWGSANQGLSNQGAWRASDPELKRHPSNNGPMLAAGRRSGRFLPDELINDYAPFNGIGTNDFNHIGIPNTGNIVKEVEKVLSNPDMFEIEKAKKLLRDQEQSLLDAIARLDEASDGESEDIMPAEGRIGTTVG